MFRLVLAALLVGLALGTAIHGRGATPDTQGPEPFQAIGTTRNVSGAVIRVIEIGFNEPLLATPEATRPENYAVFAGTNFDHAAQILVVSSYTPGPNFVELWMNPNDWVMGADYFVLIRGGLFDRNTNAIDPNRLVPVSWPLRTNLIAVADAWHVHDGAVFEPNLPSLYSEFANVDFVPDRLWSDPLPGAFYSLEGPPNPEACPGQTFRKAIAYQPFPTLFLREFFVPPEYARALAPGADLVTTLTNRFIVDDGLILYLNGTEIYRRNVQGSEPLSSTTRALSDVFTPFCGGTTLRVRNLLRPGRNVLAAAVVQSDGAVDYSVFGYQMDAFLYRTSPLPEPTTRTPRLEHHWQPGTSNLVLSWAKGAYGAKLESTTSLDHGPWSQVRDQSLPYTNRIDGGTESPPRFYRLRMTP